MTAIYQSHRCRLTPGMLYEEYLKEGSGEEVNKELGAIICWGLIF